MLAYYRIHLILPIIPLSTLFARTLSTLLEDLTNKSEPVLSVFFSKNNWVNVTYSFFRTSGETDASRSFHRFMLADFFILIAFFSYYSCDRKYPDYRMLIVCSLNLQMKCIYRKCRIFWYCRSLLTSRASLVGEPDLVRVIVNVFEIWSCYALKFNISFSIRLSDTDHSRISIMGMHCVEAHKIRTIVALELGVRVSPAKGMRWCYWHNCNSEFKPLIMYDSTILINDIKGSIFLFYILW